MRLPHRLVTPVLLAALAAASAGISACAGHRVYDPYYGDYHRWNHSEDGLYRQWEGETRRDHVDFGRRPAEEQHAYYDWRHKH
ncbi:MAG: hypothetical protein JWM41_738 [Gemmatimonadetes bacterium]|jgi:hypothetical protein|nr:hypothetical protein [Gemmatimonadota bacterium]